MSGDPWEVRDAADSLTLDPYGGVKPALVLRQGDQAIWVELPDVRAVVAALVDGATDLAEVLALGRQVAGRFERYGDERRCG